MGESRNGLASWLGLAVNPVARAVNPRSFVVVTVRAFPPVHVLSDEKFAQLNHERIYLFLVSQQELIWYTEWMTSTDEASFNEVIMNALGDIEQAAQREEVLPCDTSYTPESVTTDGWKPAQTAWETQVPGITLNECLLHGRKRVDVTLDEYAKARPDLSNDARQSLKDKFDHIFEAPSLAAFSQRLRRMIEHYHEDPILLKRLTILKEKRFLFTNHLRFDNAPAFSSALDRSMRFLDEKLQSFGQFRATESLDPMLNAWAIVNNLRPFLPDAKKAGQSLAEFFGANLHGRPWMEALNLCTVGALGTLLTPNN